MADPFGGGGLGHCYAVVIGPDCWAVAGEDATSHKTAAVSTDYGATWTRPATDPFGTGGLGSAIAAAPGLLVLGGANGAATKTLAVSTNTGATWATPSSDPFAGGSCYSVAVNGDGSLIAAGGNNSGATKTVAVSTDGGATWVTPATDPFAGGNCERIAIGPGDVIAAVGQGGSASIAVSTDGGATWVTPATDPFDGGTAWSVLITDAGLIVAGATAAGSGSRVVSSSDNGVTWAPVSGDPNPGDACFALAAHGDMVIAAGSSASNSIIVSADGGATWTGTSETVTFNCVAAGRGALWAGSAGAGILAYSADGGASWPGPSGNPFHPFGAVNAIASIDDEGRVLVGGNNAAETVTVAVLTGPPLPTISMPFRWSSYVLDKLTSQPDSATDDTLSNDDGHRLTFEWSAIVEHVTDLGMTDPRPYIPRVSLTMPTPTIDSDTGNPELPWDPTEDRSDWGRLHLSIAGRSRTVDRGKHFIPLQDSQTDPFGDETATFRLPGITEFDDPADFHIKPLAPVRFFRRDSDGNDHTLWEGEVASLEPDGRFDALAQPGLTIQCVGALYRLDLLKVGPRLSVSSHDFGQIVARTLNRARAGYALNIGHTHQPHTGILGSRTPQFTNLLTGAIQDYLSQMTDDDGNEWTLTLKRPRTPRIVLKDLTTVHATVTYGTPGMIFRLSKDYTAATTAVWGDGSAGHDMWMGARFPHLIQGATPTFPLGLGGSFVAGDGQTGFAPFASLLRRGAYGRIYSDDTYDARDLDNVKDFQDDAGVTVSGDVGAQTWEAAFAPGANQGTVAGAYVAPIHAKTETKRWLYNAQGARAGHNPNFDPNVPRVDDYIPFGNHVTKQLAVASAKQIVSRAYPAGRAGTIELTADPEEMSRFDVEAGMNIKTKAYNGDDLLTHVTRRERDWTTMTATLTVDEKGNDALTAAAIHQRKRDTADLVHRQVHGKRRSKVMNDYGPWLSEDGAGHIPLMFQQAGLWNTQKIPASPSGSIQEIRIACGTGLTEHLLNQALDELTPTTIPGAARFALLITGQPIHPNAIARMSGMSTPTTAMTDGTNPWDLHKQRLNRKFQMVYAAGGPGQALGFSPKTDPGDGTDTNLTGLFVDAGGFTYGPTEHFYLWVSLWSPVDCKIGGLMLPGAPV